VEVPPAVETSRILPDGEDVCLLAMVAGVLIVMAGL
jgi:hypothetical protein